MRRDGLNIATRFTEPCGTTIAAKAVVKVLQQAGIPLAFYNIEGNGIDRASDQLPEKAWYKDWQELPFESLLILDAGQLAVSALQHVKSRETGHKVAGLLYWELDRIPQAWIEPFKQLSPMFAGSSFIQKALQQAGVQPAPIIPVVPYDRKHLQKPRIPHQPFTFFSHFDLLSCIGRKNPMAVLQAYIDAFGQREDVRLIVKVWESGSAKLERSLLEPIIRRYPTIEFVYDNLAYEEVRALIDTCDVYVSLHRSEGLGLGMLEAMCASKPVIATNYSGNTDFLDDTCGVPIPYALIDVAAMEKAYDEYDLGGVAHWAAPDVQAASRAMSRLFDDTAYYQRLALGARARYDERAADFASLHWLQPHFPGLVQSLPRGGGVGASTNVACLCDDSLQLNLY